MKKKLLSVFFILFMLSFMPVITNAAESGTCGDNLTWTLDDNGTLTISGQGEMYDYYFYHENTWWNREIKEVAINNGVTSIGSYAFSSCTGLTSVTIPDSVTSIGDLRFPTAAA